MQRLKEGPAIYSARNYTQYPVINQNRKEYEKNACVILNHFTVRRKLTQHCKSTVLQLKKKKEQRLLERRQISGRGRLQTGIRQARGKTSKREGRESSRTRQCRAFPHYQKGKDKPAKESEQEWTRAKDEKAKPPGECWGPQSNPERNSRQQSAPSEIP